MLFVPAHNEKHIIKACTLPVDAVALDVEDSVPRDEKENARRMAHNHVALLRDNYIDVYVRINSVSSGLVGLDLESALHEELAGILIPKTQTADDVSAVEGVMERLERQKGFPRLGLVPIIESSLGLLNAHSISRASPRITAICFGVVDFTNDLGISLTHETHQLIYARSHIAIVARAARVAAIDTVYPDFRDDSGLLKDAVVARQLGFTGKAVIHPNQIPIVNRAFTPGAEEIAYARRITEAYREAERRGEGAIAVDDKMIDDAVIDQAQNVVRLAEAIEEIEQKRTQKLQQPKNP
jgi:citrate lyase subunit beta/citryl-CoA lyase